MSFIGQNDCPCNCYHVTVPEGFSAALRSICVNMVNTCSRRMASAVSKDSSLFIICDRLQALTN